MTDLTTWAWNNVDRLVLENKIAFHTRTSSGSDKLESVGASRDGIAWFISQVIYEYNKEQNAVEIQRS